MEEGKELAIELGNAENLRNYERKVRNNGTYKGTDISAWQGDIDIKSIKFTSGLFYFPEDMQEVQRTKSR